ncbi:Hypothetical protein SMAX5B_022020 [Scophthalmus maximus]|uniref:Uncharacterized protein n=1 Tax=Scophthalmus maximus TaxID=52904 RepID=A0A2U9BXZ8_SCOMX|nr:Hypothetical protein SMAX5B_022020 [Scophthalmus maximus]KAF0036605.1 hypothetical protein F2P81_011917 [Scophthalmus maximus]
MENSQLYQFNPESDTDREEKQPGSPDAFQPRLEQDGSECWCCGMPQQGLHPVILRIRQEFRVQADQCVGFRPPLD